jgi:sugar lactone lactonase YvrE
VRDVVVTPDGRYAGVLLGGRQPRLEVLDLGDRAPARPWWRRWGPAAGHPRRAATAPTRATRLAADPDGALLWLVGRTEATLVALPSLTVRGRVAHPHEAPTVAAVARDGHLWLGGHGLTEHTRGGAFVARHLPVARRPTALQAAGTVTAVAGGIWSTASPPEGAHTLLQRSRGGAWWVGLRDDRLTVWDARGRTRWSRPSGPSLRHLAITPDERHVVCTGGDVHDATSRTLRLWNIDAGMKRAELIAHDGPVVACAATPDGRRLLTGSATGELFLWDLSGELSGPGHIRRGAPRARPPGSR